LLVNLTQYRETVIGGIILPLSRYHMQTSWDPVYGNTGITGTTGITAEYRKNQCTTYAKT